MKKRRNMKKEGENEKSRKQWKMAKKIAEKEK